MLQYPSFLYQECTSGVPGSQGFPGPPGQKGEQGGVVTIEPNWRHCAWWQTNDGRDSGQVYVSLLRYASYYT